MRMQSVAEKIGALVNAEKRERERAAEKAAGAARDRHVMRAERHADEAWSLAENDPEAEPVPSPIWGGGIACAA